MTTLTHTDLRRIARNAGIKEVFQERYAYLGEMDMLALPMDGTSLDVFGYAHELAHTTAHYRRLRRRSLLYYLQLTWEMSQGVREWDGTRGWQNRSFVRIEEAIADRVASMLTGINAGEHREAHGYGHYPPVEPGTRVAHYVDVKSKEVIEWLLSQEVCQ